MRRLLDHTVSSASAAVGMRLEPRLMEAKKQVENESGTWGAVRDYSPAAAKAFDAPVPAPILAAMGVYVAAGQYLAAGYGTILSSTDMGQTWTQNNIAAPWAATPTAARWESGWPSIPT